MIERFNNGPNFEPAAVLLDVTATLQRIAARDPVNSAIKTD
jgi:hypothetical protein